MINLAGKSPDVTDKIVLNELSRAAIEVVNIPQSDGEVKTILAGKIVSKYGTFNFHRAWSYWVVQGLVPLELAEKIYNHPEGKSTVRVAGHCMCPPPKEWVSYMDDNGKELADMSELEKYDKDSYAYQSCIESTRVRWVADKTKEGKPYVDTYHIDDQSGLLLFSLFVQGKLE